MARLSTARPVVVLGTVASIALALFGSVFAHIGDRIMHDLKLTPECVGDTIYDAAKDFPNARWRHRTCRKR